MNASALGFLQRKRNQSRPASFNKAVSLCSGKYLFADLARDLRLQNAAYTSEGLNLEWIFYCFPLLTQLPCRHSLTRGTLLH